MYKKLISRLKSENIIFDRGITESEFIRIENIYNITFPEELKEFYSCGLPVSKGFYNWRNFEVGNINKIRKIIRQFKADITEAAGEVEWQSKWGREPDSAKERRAVITEMAENAPELIPVYGSRAAAEVNIKNTPVFSVVGTDVIYYGKNIADYFEREFLGKNKSFLLSEFSYVRFWSDLV
ncbi:MAG: SMI1/KNR4 family protein [Clostridiales bacterium]|nr:SMI1/KNR4 family protein [Clostridiales bacterium]